MKVRESGVIQVRLIAAERVPSSCGMVLSAEVKECGKMYSF